MSDTPKTDAAYMAYKGLVRASIAAGDLLRASRNLERENAKLRNALEHIRGSCPGRAAEVADVVLSELH